MQKPHTSRGSETHAGSHKEGEKFSKRPQGGQKGGWDDHHTRLFTRGFSKYSTKVRWELRYKEEKGSLL